LFFDIFLNVLAKLYRLDPFGQVGPPNLLPVQGLSDLIPFVAFFIQLLAIIILSGRA
tara:strand:+ start:494 stop:664 length:171 start_codon:yes stop_codon:yes gene_type:complete